MYNKWRNIIGTLALFVFYIILCSACTKQDIVIEKNGNSENPDTITSDKSIKINLSAFVDRSSDILTVNLSTLDAGRFVTAFVYNIDGTLLNEKKYYSKVAGSLSPVTSSIFLTEGTYNFYGAGVNNLNAKVPTFINGEASGLSNNKDYIWWNAKSYNLNSSNSNLSINFNHCGVQIILDISAESPILADSIKNVSLTPSNPSGVKWNLANGIITFSTELLTDSVLTSTTKSNNSFIAQYTMVPFKPSNANVQIPVYFEAYLNGLSTKTKYKVNLPIMNNEFSAGNAYRYRIVISGDKVNLGDITIENWLDVDEMGNPIIPELEK